MRWLEEEEEEEKEDDDENEGEEFGDCSANRHGGGSYRSLH